MNTDDIASRQEHWQRVYRDKAEDELSWHEDEPARSLGWIREVAQPGQDVIDVGGGSSRLAARLVDAGFGRVAVLDLSEAALARARQQAGASADRIEWIVGDVTRVQDVGAFDVWHDRAVLHFLVEPEDQAKYVELARRTVRPGGYLVIATFSLDGPDKCSGLPVQRYGAGQLAERFAPDFALHKHEEALHRTPWGRPQAFLHAVLHRRDAPA